MSHKMGPWFKIICIIIKIIYLAEYHMSAIFLLAEWLVFFSPFPAGYVVQLHQFQDYFKEEEKVRVDENKRSDRRRNRNDPLPLSH
jgi:hypothetical protein